MTRYLVTGGAGFIGGWLVQELLKQDGALVTVVDNLSSNPIPLTQWQAELEAASDTWGENAEMSFFKGNVKRILRFAFDPFDVIYHLASPVGPAGILKHRGAMVQSIVDDTYTVLNLAQEHEAKLVFVSTSEIYGGGVDGACTEDTDRIIQAQVTTRLEYAVAKLAAETAVYNTNGVHASIVRPFNVAGPRQSSKGGFVLARFVEQGLAGGPLTVFGDGYQLRAFSHVKDVARGLIAAERNGKDKAAYNLGFRENRTTINALAEEVCTQLEMLDKPRPAIIHTDGKTVYGPDYAEAKDKWPEHVKHEELSWWPQHSLSEIVRDALAYALQHQRI
jgi:nucleoside-diphosphate-sugar epimerase